MTDPVTTEGKPGPWGLWATLGLTLVVYLVFFFLSLLVVIALGALYMGANPGAGGEELSEYVGGGFVAFLSVAAAAPFSAGVVLLFVWLRRGPAMGDYLGLIPFRARAALAWSGGLLLFLIASDLLTYALGRPIVPEIMAHYYWTSGPLVLAWFAVIAAGPVFEEILFRGFMFRGIQSSALGNRGAIVITAALWAVTHIQYDLYLIATVFVLGLLFGAARAVTGSLYLAIALHVANNLIAVIGLHLLAE